MVDFHDLNLDKVKANDFTPIPAGEYPAVIIKSEQKPTKDGTGKRLNLTFQILNGPYQNRQVTDGINTHNKSEKAEQIGRSQLKALCEAVNKPSPKSSEELYNIPLIIRLKVKPDQNGDDRNEVAGYKPRVPPKPPAQMPVYETPAREPNMIEQAFEDDATAPVIPNPFARK